MRGWRSLAAVVIVSAVSGAVALQWLRDGGDSLVGASCEATLVWAGNEYSPNGQVRARVARRLGVGTERACLSDEDGRELIPEQRREIVALEGVPATVAVGVRDERAIYLASGFLSVVRGHPSMTRSTVARVGRPNRRGAAIAASICARWCRSRRRGMGSPSGGSTRAPW